MKKQQAKELLNKWQKDRGKDAIREMNLDEQRLNGKEWSGAYEEREHGFFSLTKD